VVSEAAGFIKADGLVTRDTKGFKKSKIQVYSPSELLSNLTSREETLEKN